MENTRQLAENLVYQYAGSPSELKRNLRKLGIRYTKVNNKAIPKYILRGQNIGRVEVKL